jgi:dienelactone hydrolase/predicted Ser/Thr protein kinase
MPKQFPLVGRTLSHYRVLAHLGGGGMGVVYKAEDTRLKRLVALKFLPSELTRDPEARERFVQEAQAASALDHPNICTIYEIDSADEQLFIAMAYCDGETLKKRLQRGPLSVADALDIAVQTVRGLEKAHHAGIVHRDIKPANLMITADGLVKIVDFGIAKLTDRTGLTRTGTTIGTITYMAPEQVLGSAVDHRADLWAVGVVLYEMLTGAPPFTGDHDVAVLNNIVNQEPAPLRSHRPEVPADVERIVTWALVKRPEARYASAAQLARELVACHSGLLRSAAAITAATPRPRVDRRSIIAAAIAAAVLIGVPGAWIVKRNADLRRAEAGLVEIAALADRDDYAAAVARAHEMASTLGDDPRLADQWNRISFPQSITSDPPGADVYLKRYTDLPGDWTYIGRTPIEAARIPHGAFRWKVQKEGFEPHEFVSPSFAPGLGPMHVDLPAAGSLPANMVLIRRPALALTLTGFDFSRTVQGGDYLIDKYEMTNGQFKEFVDAGGYTNPRYWKYPFRINGRTLSFEEAMNRFRDRTGRPGPSTWEVGTYPTGREDYPVSGVSWYEAAAYADFVGKSLPTMYHWSHAAGVWEAAYITPLSNIESNSPVPVGSRGGVSPAGLFDTVGNVKEWSWNEVAPGGARYVLGGGWSDPSYAFVFAETRDPFDRGEMNGFRLVKYLDVSDPSAAVAAPIATPTRDYSRETPVSEEVFDVYRDLYAYDPRPLDGRIEAVDDSRPQWVKQQVSFTAAYGGERVTAYLFLPKNTRPPFQTVLYFPGSDAIRRSRSEDATLQLRVIDFVMMSGRALLYPIYKGTYERNPSVVGLTSSWPEMTRAYRDLVIQQINDARRGVDYLESRTDIRRDALAYYGFSWGGRFGSLVLALEPRLKTGVLLVGGLAALKAPPEADPFNFAPRVSVPVLMLNARNENIYPVETAQRPLFERLGTRPEHKQHRLFDGSHDVILQRKSELVKEMLDWFDKYLGPVTQ